MKDLLDAAKAIRTFAGEGFTQKVSILEKDLSGLTCGSIPDLLNTAMITSDLLRSANLLKTTLGQINVVIHTIGILLLLEKILQPNECISYISLGAGNTGRAFDLETDLRVAEFKFSHWKSKSNTIRQNALFKDFYTLAEHTSSKMKFLYVLETKQPLQFLNGRRSLKSVLSRNRKLWDDFTNKYGSQYATVDQYYADKQSDVAIVSIGHLLPE